jgi:HEPN domain-containing protein
VSASHPGAWIRKARQDTRSARHPLLDPPELEDVAFHIHQAVEKAAEAVLWRRAFNIRAAVGPALIPTLRPS